MTALAFRFGMLAFALMVDRFFGEPPALWQRIPHPVVLMGRAIGWLDAALNDHTLMFSARRRRGVVAVAVLVAGTALLGWLVAAVLERLMFGSVVEMLLVAVLLAQKSLVDHVAAVDRALCTAGIEGGRDAVAQIVGRDVTQLDEAGICRAAIESAAENFSDGVVAPAFWFLLLGLPGLLVYKAVNTADSMVGNPSAHHRAYGWAPARLDDLLNFVPARLSMLLIAAAACLSRRPAGVAIRAALADAPKHRSPNAGWPEAAAAGALGLALGGPRNYGEIAVSGAWLNEDGRKDADPADVRAATQLIDMAWAVLVIATLVAVLILVAIAL
jgi:adenosylcobinamide-phosphate synthase